MTRYVEVEEVTKESGWFKFKYVKNDEVIEELQQNYDENTYAYDKYIELFNSEEVEDLEIYKEVK